MAEPVDIDQIKRNALAQHIALSEIAIQYVGLTHDEKAMLAELNLLAHESESVVLGRFTEAGEALFKGKIMGVLYLSA